LVSVVALYGSFRCLSLEVGAFLASVAELRRLQIKLRCSCYSKLSFSSSNCCLRFENQLKEWSSEESLNRKTRESERVRKAEGGRDDGVIV
jgi:hypothetical protein